MGSELTLNRELQTIVGKAKTNNKLSSAWLDEESYATTLLTCLLDHYGEECLEWTAMTISLQVKDDFGVAIPKVNLDKVMAAIAIVTTDFFFTSVTRFVQLCNVLSGGEFDPTTFDPADVAEMAWGVSEALILDPPSQTGETPFSAEIVGYIQYMLQEEGVIKVPPVLAFAKNTQAEFNVSENLDSEFIGEFMISQQAKNQEILDVVQENLAELQQQLAALPLKSESVAALFEEIK